MNLFKSGKITPAQIITLGFAGIILIGAFLLTLPISSRAGTATSFADALFTATSAVCVTGLIVHDTFLHWSIFGQAVILLLIQIGGMGVVTVAVTLFMLSGKKISLKQRIVMKESISVSQTGGIVKFTGFIIKSTIVIEIIGALILAYRFIPEAGIAGGLWAGIFHSISAFCNAGFDLMGRYSPFNSLCGYVGDPLVNFCIMFLIITGGIGFLVWNDIATHGLRFSAYKLQTRIVLVTTFFLILLPFLFFFLYEMSLPQWNELTGNEKLLASLFQAVTPRTAGFNTIDLAKLSPNSYLVTIILMMIGGSPGSTAGGFKTTTLAVLVLCAFCFMRRKESVEAYDRRFPEQTVNNAVTIFFLYIFFFLSSSLFISIFDGLSLMDCMFEAASAIGTVGLSCGVTGECSLPSRFVLMGLMYFGRVGGLTLIYAMSKTKYETFGRKPVESIIVG